MKTPLLQKIFVIYFMRRPDISSDFKDVPQACEDLTLIEAHKIILTSATQKFRWKWVTDQIPSLLWHPWKSFLLSGPSTSPLVTASSQLVSTAPLDTQVPPIPSLPSPLLSPLLPLLLHASLAIEGQQRRKKIFSVLPATRQPRPRLLLQRLQW